MYRDELTTAAERIDRLQLRIEAQDQELAGLRQQVAKLYGSRWRTTGRP